MHRTPMGVPIAAGLLFCFCGKTKHSKLNKEETTPLLHFGKPPAFVSVKQSTAK